MQLRARGALALVTSIVAAASLASPAAATTTPAPTPTATPTPDAVQVVTRPTITGSPKYGKKLIGHSGRWSTSVDRYSYQWLRDGQPITGETTRRHVVRSADVGHKIRFRVTVERAGRAPGTAVSTARTGAHVRGVRKVVTYSVRTRGSVHASLSTFKRLAQETYDDPRGWRATGIRFERVSSGGDFTLVLSRASKVPSFSSACSSTYSCRVGRFVVINETRWQQASPAWKKAHGSLRDYRNLVVNHETGHWLGRGHVSCGGAGQLAPVMQQQSKGLGGCKINPWPRKGELHSSRFGY